MDGTASRAEWREEWTSDQGVRVPGELVTCKV